MNKKILSVFLAVTLILSMGAFHFQVYAENPEGDNQSTNTDANGTVISDEPIVLQKYESEEYKQYLKDKENGDIEKYGGLIPSSTYKLETAKTSNTAARSAALPSVYDPRDTGMTTPVKNQSPRDICWAFAGVANMETAVRYKYNKVVDFSENYFNYLYASNALGENTKNPYNYYNRVLDSGISHDIIMHSTVNQKGPVREDEFPFSIKGALPDTSLFEQPPSLYVYDYDYEKGYSYSLGIDEVQGRITDIKNMVYKDHSAILNMAWAQNAPFSTVAYYRPYINSHMLFNHEVCIVGWDDTYSKNNFAASQRPDSDGAFIVKNSWGPTAGQGGYFYLSYQDVSVFQSDICSVSDISETERYDHMYYHAKNSPSETIIMHPDDYWLANVYDVSSAGQILDAIGIMTLFNNTQLEIYVNPHGAALNQNSMQLVYSGIKAVPGYETIGLQNPIALDSSDGKFSIVIHIISEDWTIKGRHFIPVGKGFKEAAGKSYISYDAKSWTDSTAESSYYINAYTSDSGNSLSIRFQVPSNWGSQANITLSDAGKYSGTTHTMTYIAPGIYEYRNKELHTCSFQIDDGVSGHRTNLLSAKSSVLVQNNTVTDRNPRPMRVDFKKPSNWGNDIKLYYYSNDDKKTVHSAWPGVAMTNSGDGWFNYEISDMDDVCVIFTDGKSQAPGLLQPGIPLKQGQDLIWQDYNYSYDDGTPFSFHFYPPSSDWAESIIVNVSNGPTQKTTTLKKNEKGYYEYNSPDISRGTVTISDGYGASVTALRLSGNLTVKGDKWIIQPEQESTIIFKPPTEWKKPGTTYVKYYVYYYTDDGRSIAPYEWPGIPMEQMADGSERYTATISDIGDVRVVFSDGSHQLPALKQPGIQLKEGQHLINENKASLYEDGSLLSVHFIPPAGWGDNATISLTYISADGQERSMMTPMRLNEDGVYVKNYTNIQTGVITIKDLLGNATKELLVTGPVIISQNTAVQRPTEPLHVTFQKPASWGDTVYIYYYANDDSYTSIMDWPGRTMQKTGENQYSYDINDMKYTRAIFTDGIHQYPSGANGVPVNPQGETSIKGS